MWWLDWRGNPDGCHAVTVPMSPIAYITMKQCLYLFLFDRAKVVHDALKINGKLMQAWRWIVWLSSLVGVPILTWWLFFLFWRSKVLPEGICVQYATSAAGVASVAAADFVLSLAMLVLFIIPLSTHANKVESLEMTPVFKRLMRRNLIISVMMMASTLVALLFMTVELSVVFGETPDPSLEHLQVWSTFFPLMDSIATICLSHVLSNGWMPLKLRGYLAKIDTTTHRSTAPDSKGGSPNAIGNSHRSIALTAPSSPDSRPTSGRVKPISGEIC